MSDKNKNVGDSSVSIWRHKKTHEYIIALRAGVMTKFVNRKFIDKNNLEWIFFSPLETTCKLGNLELNSDYQGFEDEIKKLGTDSDEIKNISFQFIRNDANFDEYGTDRGIDAAFTKLWKVGSISDDNNTQKVNRNFDFSYVGMKPDDSCGTVANDFWRQFFAYACESGDSKYMLFYKHMNIEPFLRCNGWTSLNTSISMGPIENLRKEIAYSGHFIGCDGFIYNFDKIYHKETVDLYKRYIDFILTSVSKDDINKQNKSVEEQQKLASEIIKYISDLDTESKKFIETNKVEYNPDNERFEMNVGEYRRDATAWIYSKFFPGSEIKCKKHQFVTNLTKEEFEKNNSKRNVYRYEDLVGTGRFDKMKKAIAESWYNDRNKEASRYGSNFNFINNIAKYFNKDFGNINFIDAETATELKIAMNSSGTVRIGDFFSEPKEVERMLKGEPSIRGGQSSSNDLFGEYIRRSRRSDDNNFLFLTSKGRRLVEALKQGFANRKHVCKDNEEFEKYFSIAVARALFETLQLENANYNDFIERLCIYVSFMFKKDAYQLAIKNKNFYLYKLNELKKPFDLFKIEIKKINDELTLLRNEYRKKEEEMQTIQVSLEQNTNTEQKKQLEEKYDKLIEEKRPILPQIQNLESQLKEKRTEMNLMFLTTYDFGFLQESESPIISEDSFNQLNNRVLEVIKKKIDETNIKEFAKLKFGLLDGDDKLQQGEEQLKADLCEAIAQDIKYVTDYDGLEHITKKAIINRFSNELDKAMFDMLSTFKKYEPIEGDYRENLSVMRVYQFIQHIFNAVGHLAFEKCDNKKDLQMIIFNRENIIFNLGKNPDKIFLSEGKSAFDSLVMNLIQGTSLEKNHLEENIAWIRDMVHGLDQKTIIAEEMSQFSLAAFNEENRKIKNGFFSNSRKNNAIQTFFIPLQTIEEQVGEDKYKIWTNKIKPNLGPKIRMADLDRKCGLTLSDNWEPVGVDQMIEDSKKDWMPDKSYEYNEEESVDNDGEPIEMHESINNNINNNDEKKDNGSPGKVETNQANTEENNNFMPENNNKENLLKTKVEPEEKQIDFINEAIELKHGNEQDQHAAEKEKNENSQDNNVELKQENGLNVNEQDKELGDSNSSINIGNNDFDSANNTKNPSMPLPAQYNDNQTNVTTVINKEQEKDLKENKKNDKDNNKNRTKNSIWSRLAKKISGLWNRFIEFVKSLLCLGSKEKIDLSTGEPNNNVTNKLVLDNRNQREQIDRNVISNIKNDMGK